jgi:NAD(P)-dependent dehydrogenase (short-subunit alcohol dehydrogenase family)
MEDKVIVITGASSGIGESAARLLRAQGANVVVVGRSAKTAEVARELDSPYYLADFTKLDDVRRLAEQLRRNFPRIDVLANNAGGVMSNRRVLTVDGFEMTIQVNYLAAFLLTNLLLETLIASRAAVIATSSLAQRGAGKLDPGDFTLADNYGQQGAYGKAKLMDVLFAKELNARYHSAGISAAAFHPGVVRTDFSKEFGGGWDFIYKSFIRHLLISPQKGADTLVWLASSQPDRDWQPGQYYQKRKPKPPSRQAQDPRLANDLWESTTRALGLDQPEL